MKNILRIILFMVILIGSALLFRFWALNNFNLAFSDLNNESFPSNFPKTAVSDIETIPIIEVMAPEIISEEVYSDNKIIKDESKDINKEELKDINLTFTSPSKDANLYIGCKYQISLSSSAIIKSINLSLYDFGTRQSQGPVSSGISRNNTADDIKNIEWKVGGVWPGKYFISTSDVNGQELNKKSSAFNIIKVPENINKTNIEEFCKNN